MIDLSSYPPDLKGQVALVTGAAQGLGFAIAQTLARRRAMVLLGDLQRERTEAAASSILDEGLNVKAVSIDIADSESVRRCFDQVVDSHNRLDIVVNNAGIGQNVSAIVDLSDEEWQRVIGVTLTGTFYCCRAAAKIMQTQKSGAIVNIASINGHNPAPLVAAYNAAKAAVINLTRCLALELAAYGVRVNAVNPGPVYTEFNKTIMSQRARSLNLPEAEVIERVRSSIPLGRWGEADDIASAVAFLCSPEAKWITGEVLRVSGGLEGVALTLPKCAKG